MPLTALRRQTRLPATAPWTRGPGITLGLFSPLNPDMALALPSLYDLTLTKPETYEKAISVCRTVFLAATLVQLWPVVRDVRVLASGDSSE